MLNQDKGTCSKNLELNSLQSESRKFQEGELVILYDLKGKTYCQRLTKSGRFISHLGVLEYINIIGKEEGESVLTSIGKELFPFRLTFNDYIKKMERKSAIIHPKDLGIILIWADIFPGARVVEAGSGSGSLLLALLRATGEKGEVFSYDMREDLQDVARRNVSRFLGEVSNLEFKIKDIYTGIDERDIDRIILDLPTPWEALGTIKESLRSGGIVLSYIPTITQAERFTKTLQEDGNFFVLGTMELLLRSWNIEGLSVRPEHRMIGHTGFITLARKIKRKG
ncbi:MAG: methyltransferase domain-containing protein [Candidatus Omnitrophica bacterium]|nr:methyltransferase domain-containing protein [Candidatus Omnitrophota bacterium]